MFQVQRFVEYKNGIAFFFDIRLGVEFWLTTNIQKLNYRES